MGTSRWWATLAGAILAACGGHDRAATPPPQGVSPAAPSREIADDPLPSPDALDVAASPSRDPDAGPADAARVAPAQIDQVSALIHQLDAVRPAARRPIASGATDATGDTGMLGVVASPGCNISIDGHYIGTTPLAPRTLFVGVHTVLCRNPTLHRQQTRSVTLHPGERFVVRFVHDGPR